MIISEKAAKINNKCNVIAIYWLKSQTTCYGDFMYHYVLKLLFANAVCVKIVMKCMWC